MTPARHAARAYLRHPVDIPIEIAAESSACGAGRRLKDVGAGGLAFASERALPVGSMVRVRIAVLWPTFETHGRVVWCKACAGCFDVGLQFVSVDDAFAVRMVEQVCQIEHYRKAVQETEGRQLDAEAAATEWISKYAANFPCPQ
ncbi:MAG TPA: PilZ domain-containing protein [Accumulibacter sp.]|uniref:PilZ domain-containing protein n=1 Tax=Accumulibacter sp. TaxID=2053492 RepID=UPI002C31702B|nr:PilZ domain-containing protein [Accumulibacter sp.]HRF74659.1 PilZ domain-containing protein [Accumulibacter sp.]